MKILFLTSYYEPDLCAGSFRAKALFNAISRNAKLRHIELHIITTMPNRYHEYNILCDKNFDGGWYKISRINIPKHHSGALKQGLSFLYYSFSAYFFSKSQNYDIVIATSSRFLTGFTGYLIAKRNNSELYLDLRDLFIETLPQLKPSFFIRSLSKFLEHFEKKMYSYARIVNVVSPAFRGWVERRGARIVTEYTNGVDSFFNGQNFSAPTKKPVINVLYAGNVGDGQALHKIIPDLALTFRNKIKFKIVGSGSKITELKKYIEQKKLENVEILPPVNRASLLATYHKSDVLFLHLDSCPAFDKVLPSKVFEYSVTGRPILAGVSGFAKYFLETKVKGSFVFKPNDVNDAIQKINLLLESRNFYPREEFEIDYARHNIMDQMVQKILKMSDPKNKSGTPE